MTVAERVRTASNRPPSWGIADPLQRSIAELRNAVQEKNFVKGLPEVYLRKFSLLKTKPEYIWLGDYPKEAEQRKQGLGSFAAGAR